MTKKLKIWLGLLICLLCWYSIYCIMEYNTQEISVTGTVIGSNIEGAYKGKHHNNYETNYIMAVRPNNPDYKILETYVSFSTYSAYKVGSTITFPTIKRYKVDKNFEKFPDYIFIPLFLFTLVFGCYYFILILMEGVED